MKSIIISDLHLGNPYSNWRKLYNFLKDNPTENLFLNGDIIDQHYLDNNNKTLSDEEMSFFRWMMSLNAIYIRGNHDWEKIDEIYGVKTFDHYEYDGYYISHGHNTIFKNPVTDSVSLIKLIDWSIRFISRFQKIHKGFLFIKGKFTTERGTEFSILSENSRSLFKTGLKIISLYKRKINKYHKMGYRGVICGHIHLPEIQKLYMNSGDWIENNSALIYNNGKWELIKITN